MTRRNATTFSLLLGPLALAVALASASTAAAQPLRTDPDQWTQPVVAGTVLEAPGQGSVAGDTLSLPSGRRIALEARAVDQDGRSFPQERFRFGFDLDPSCRGLVELESFEHGTINLRTGNRRGTCEVLFWVPNNMNLDRRIRIEVGRNILPERPASDSRLSGSRSEVLASSLFRAILGRAPDQRWLADAAETVHRGQTRDLVRNLLGTAEFRSRVRRLSPDAILESFYRGLLGRGVDASGQRTYVDDLRSGRYQEVIMDIVSSDELQQRLAREAGR